MAVSWTVISEVDQAEVAPSYHSVAVVAAVVVVVVANRAYLANQFGW